MAAASYDMASKSADLRAVGVTHNWCMCNSCRSWCKGSCADAAACSYHITLLPCACLPGSQVDREQSCASCAGRKLFLEGGETHSHCVQVKALIQEGNADFELRDRWSLDALDEAMRERREDVAKFLQLSGALIGGS